MHRRDLLKLGVVGGAVVLTPVGWELGTRLVAAAPGASPSLAKFVEALPVPPSINATGGGTFNIALAAGSHRFHSALPASTTWGYGGAPYLGPTFVVRRGVPVTVRATNLLGAHPLAASIDRSLHGPVAADATRPRAALHLHGGHVEARSDGGPEATFTPKATYTYRYANDQEATTLWYHDHALGITRLNVYAGLAGLYLVRDGRDTGQPGPLGVPTGPYELPIVIQDKQFDGSGKVFYPPAPWVPEFFGDVAVVNGKAWPNLDVRRGIYRFRIVNGSNARFYNLQLSGNLPFRQIGTDGGLLDAPVTLSRLLLAPGERADVLVDFSGLAAGTKVRMTNDAVAPFPSGRRALAAGGAPLPDIMQFTVTSAVGFTGPVPSALRTSPLPALPAPAKVRHLSLVEIMDPATGMPVKALLNNLPFDTAQVKTPKVNTVEQWNIINTTGDAHPIHLHLVQFRLKSRQPFDVAKYMAAAYPTLGAGVGADTGPWPAPSADPFVKGPAVGPAANERGWKDTVRANPGEITRIIVPFGGTAAGLAAAYTGSFTGDYVWHCHILEHEDNEMMLPYRVV